MSGAWRKVEGEFVDTERVLPFELPEDALELTVPNTLPHDRKLDTAPVIVKPVVKEPVAQEAPMTAQPRSPRLVRVRAIRKRIPSCDHTMMWNTPSSPCSDDYRSYGARGDSNFNLWSCFALTGFVGSIFLAYYVYRSRDRSCDRDRELPVQRVRTEWVLDDFGTLHRAQVFAREYHDDASDDASEDASSSC